MHSFSIPIQSICIIDWSARWAFQKHKVIVGEATLALSKWDVWSSVKGGGDSTLTSGNKPWSYKCTQFSWTERPEMETQESWEFSGVHVERGCMQTQSYSGISGSDTHMHVSTYTAGDGAGCCTCVWFLMSFLCACSWKIIWIRSFREWNVGLNT